MFFISVPYYFFNFVDYIFCSHSDINDRVAEKKRDPEIIEALNLEEMTPEDIETDAPLFGEDGLGLDSIDALELIVLVEKKYLFDGLV